MRAAWVCLTGMAIAVVAAPAVRAVRAADAPPVLGAPGDDGHSETVLAGAYPTAGEFVSWTRPALALDADLSPRIALVRDDPSGGRLDVCRRDGASWRADPVATGVDVGVRASIRVDAAGATHVAWAAADGTVRVATDGGGAGDAWAEEVAAAVSGRIGDVALAVAPGGARRVAYVDGAARTVHVARDDGSGWTDEVVSAAVGLLPSCDVECAGDGTFRAAWTRDENLVLASEATGAWTEVARTWAFGGWGATSGVDLVVLPGGRLLVADVEVTQFDLESYVRGWDGVAWTAAFLEPWAVAPAPGLAANGGVVVVFDAGPVTRRRRDDGTGATTDTVLDGGPGDVLRIDPPAATVPEDETTLRLSVQRTGGGVSRVAGLVDAGGGCHAAYVVTASGDLRYVTDRDPGRPVAATVDVVAESGTAVVPEDFEVLTPRLSWADDDSGARTVLVRVHADGVRERDETGVVRLAAPTGGVALAEAASAATLTITAPEVPESAEGATFVALRGGRAADGRVVLVGRLHTGLADLDPRAPLRVTFGDAAVALPGLRWGGRRGERSAPPHLGYGRRGERTAPPPKRYGGAWRGATAAGSLTLRRDPRSRALWRFALRVRGQAALDISYPVDLRVEAATFDATSRVALAPANVPGLRAPLEGFVAPSLRVTRLSGRTGPNGALTFEAVLAVDAAYPTFEPNVRLTLGGTDVVSASGADFVVRRWLAVAKSASYRVEVSPTAHRVRIDVADVDLSALPEGSSLVELRLVVGANWVTTRVPLTVRRGRIVW